MRIVRAPLRVTLGGGGTDLPGFYEKHGGFLIAAAINKYIYMTGSLRPFDRKLWLSYSNLEVVDSLELVRHDLLKKALAKYPFDGGLELHSISEVPSHSGLGSSGSLIVCALTTLNSLFKREMSRQDVAELASSIEIIELGRSCGKQDHFVAAIGGIITLDIDKSGAVKAQNLPIGQDTVKRLQSNLLIYYTGIARDANTVLEQQSAKLKKDEGGAVERLQKIKDIGYRSRDRLLQGDLDGFGRLLHEHWELKKGFQSGMTTSRIDEIYDAAMKAGALGGKVMGAGGGGFYMFYVPPERHAGFHARLRGMGLQELDWSFSFSGCEVIFAN